MTILDSEMRLASKVAWRIGSKWAAVEIDDLQQHLFLWMVENERALTRWRDEEGDNGKLYVSLRREAAKFCAKEQAVNVGQSINKDNFYTVDLVKRALPFVFEETPQSTVVVNPVTGEPQQASGDFNLALTIMTDIRQHFWGLNAEIRQVLEWRFRDGLTFEEIAELRSMTKQGAMKSVDRAVQRLVDALAGERL